MNLVSYFSTHNREEITNSTHSGCYFCCTVFDSAKVVDWVDSEETAVCPNCGIDSVIAGATDVAELKKIAFRKV